MKRTTIKNLQRDAERENEETGQYYDWGDAYRDSQDYRANDYKGVKIQEFLVG